MFPISTTTTTYTQARENLANLLDRIENENSIAILVRRGHKDIALLAADELSSILETIYLLRSPSNAHRLLEAIEESKQRDNLSQSPQNIKSLCEELGIERQEG